MRLQYIIGFITGLIPTLAGGLLMLALMSGCSLPDPPQTIRVSAELPDEVQLGAAMARDAWCAADVGWCPELSADEGVPIQIGHWSRETSTEAPGAYGHNDRRVYVELSANWFSAGLATAQGVAVVLAHEFGHFAASSHTDDGLMAEYRPLPPEAYEPVVDAAARELWCRHQGCPSRRYEHSLNVDVDLSSDGSAAGDGIATGEHLEAVPAPGEIN